MTIENKVIVIPNGKLMNNSLTNVTERDERRLDLKVGISYESDLKKAKEILESREFYEYVKVHGTSTTPTSYRISVNDIKNYVIDAD